MTFTMPEPAAWLIKSSSVESLLTQTHKPTMILSDETVEPLYTADALRDVLEQAAKLDWTEIMRDGQLVTWGDADTLGYRVYEQLRAMKGAIK